jgi:LCP family protein required for cell wall assembly
MYKRFLLGALFVVLASATTVATAALLEVKDYAKIIGGGDTIAGIGGALDNVPPGGPQTILLLGSDRRFADIATKAPVRSDTIILVRLDPARGATAVMSLPRDLKVRIPNHGTDKINAAYAIGGPKLTVKTVRGLLHIPINHVINVNFGGFRRAVNRLKCVYVDIDRRYFNDNHPPYGGGGNYATIDVKAGYQRLCGQDALDFVRYRHFDSDLVRAARQQEFLRQAKEQIGVSKVLGDRKGLLRVFAAYTQTDIRGSSAILQLLKLAVESAQHPVQEVHFPGQITGDFVTVRRADLRRIKDQFMNAKGTPAPPAPRGQAVKRSSTRSSAAKKRSSRRSRGSSALPPGMQLAPGLVQDQAVRIATDVPFAVYYPRAILNGAEYLPDHSRVYTIADRNGHRYRAYRIVVKTNEIGQYYGIQGTSWSGPPILDNPSERRRLGRRTYELFFDGDRLRLVAWRSAGAAYWVSNTLLQTLTNKQMLALARSVSKVR